MLQLDVVDFRFFYADNHDFDTSIVSWRKDAPITKKRVFTFISINHNLKERQGEREMMSILLL